MSKNKGSNSPSRSAQEQASQSANQTTGDASGASPRNPEQVNDPKAIRLIAAMALFPIVSLIIVLIIRKCG